MADQALAVDIGGTKVAAGIVTSSGLVSHRVRVDTPANSSEATTDAILRAISEVGEAGDGLALGVGAAGLIDRDGKVLYSPNLPFRNYPLQDRLADSLGKSVVVENDANAAAWGEYRVGAAREATVAAVLLTIGTGVGGGLVLEDRLSRGGNGLGAEFGHMIVAEGARQCPCGNRGCLEAMASGRAIGRTAQEWLDEGRVPADSALWRLEPLTGASVGQAAHNGDEAAVEVVAECGRWLGVGVASLVNAFDPEVVVIGGGASALGELLLAPTVKACEERVLGLAHRVLPVVRNGGLGGDAGLVGAGLLALEQS